jgi:hypothetical protein
LADSPPEVRRRLGLGEAETAALRAAIAADGPAGAAHLIRDEWVPQFVVAGTPAECRAELTSLLAAHGIDELQVSIADLATGAETLAMVAQLAR